MLKIYSGQKLLFIFVYQLHWLYSLLSILKCFYVARLKEDPVNYVVFAATFVVLNKRNKVLRYRLKKVKVIILKKDDIYILFFNMYCIINLNWYST